MERQRPRLWKCNNLVFLEAQAWCHRIGQSKAVKVYRLITRNSYEREMLDKASLKLGLDRAVLQSMSGNKEGNNNGPVQQFSKKEIEDLLRKGAYAAIMDKNDEGNRFCEEDIDQILQRRATTITVTRSSTSNEPTWGPVPCRFPPSIHPDGAEERAGGRPSAGQQGSLVVRVAGTEGSPPGLIGDRPLCICFLVRS
ncbi:Chromodomain-helicase-DNA-binding protein 8 [Dissostichus eleginoides]|uniref:Chromodomain-helicase-DNA-binding protein 8 n=1 Tax=Dissostichus eleginoides TaxID=100907 RepID=A0AAD9CAM4_DISEL|nr:Chromodomain-helicase-DNA-binding protein 8 [Dissostichus eleginoides]